MLKENNPLLHLNLIKKKSSLYNYYNNISEAFYSLFDLILEDPIESFTLECLHIFFGYCQLMAFIFDSTVSN